MVLISGETGSRPYLLRRSSPQSRKGTEGLRAPVRMIGAPLVLWGAAFLGVLVARSRRGFHVKHHTVEMTYAMKCLSLLGGVDSS